MNLFFYIFDFLKLFVVSILVSEKIHLNNFTNLFILWYVIHMLYKGSCHCKSVEIEVETNLSIIKQCNCSMCKRKNAKMNILPKENLKITKGEDNLSVYQFGTNVAKHFFCKTCGIYTHHQRKSDPNGIGVNIGCFDEVDSFSVKSEVLDNK